MVSEAGATDGAPRTENSVATHVNRAASGHAEDCIISQSETCGQALASTGEPPAWGEVPTIQREVLSVKGDCVVRPHRCGWIYEYPSRHEDEVIPNMALAQHREQVLTSPGLLNPSLGPKLCRVTFMDQYADVAKEEITRHKRMSLEIADVEPHSRVSTSTREVANALGLPVEYPGLGVAAAVYRAASLAYELDILDEIDRASEAGHIQQTREWRPGEPLPEATASSRADGWKKLTKSVWRYSQTNQRGVRRPVDRPESTHRPAPDLSSLSSLRVTVAIPPQGYGPAAITDDWRLNNKEGKESKMILLPRHHESPPGLEERETPFLGFSHYCDEAERDIEGERKGGPRWPLVIRQDGTGVALRPAIGGESSDPKDGMQATKYPSCRSYHRVEVPAQVASALQNNGRYIVMSVSRELHGQSEPEAEENAAPEADVVYEPIGEAHRAPELPTSGRVDSVSAVPVAAPRSNQDHAP